MHERHDSLQTGVVVTLQSSSILERGLKGQGLANMLALSLRKFHFTYFFVTGEPRLHKPSGFFWAPLRTYNSFINIPVLYYILAKQMN